MKRRWIACVLAGAMTLGLFGCGSSAVNGTGTESSGSVVTGTGTSSGTDSSVVASDEDLNVMMETPVESLDPQQATDGTSFEVIADYTDGLMQMDENGEPVKALAESYDVSDDGLTYTFKIRDDANWSNGDPVTAQDFVFAWQRAVDPSVASEYAYMLSDIGQVKNAADIIAGTKDKSELGVTAVDDKTMKVELNVPVPYFLSLMYFPTFYPVNEKFFESCKDTFGTSPETTLSDGAFILDDYEPAATSFHLKKNPDYYDAGRIKLAGIQYQVIQDSQQALMSYQNGELDTTMVNGDQVDSVKDDPEFKAVGAGYLWYLSPNISAVPELANQNIRLAMTMAIDRDSIVNDVLKDGSEATYTAVPLDFATGPDGKYFSEDQTKFKDVCSYDADKAAEYWKKGLEELGESSMTINMLVDADDAPQKVAQVLQEQLQNALPGLTINITVEPKKQRVQDMQDGNFQLGLTRWGPDYDDPMTYLGMWVTNNSNNYGLWSDKDYDAIIDKCTTGDLVSDTQGRWDAMYDAEKIVMDQAVIFPLYTQCNAMMVKSNVKGIEYHPVALNRVYKDCVKGAS
ncbi:MAG: peptide ABC transporter substrate-binding protein [Eubacteriales bacterium]|jgi:oligopeptide transport system substrate-binding protein|nr:peptide ABC transporter substrate-binding protein [Lachnospiraceae bacterium]MDD5860596.1 peptide ABC transporter substrate-binding protein [Eubacteriales bacterium]MCH4064492.1 peptide ABC transporter substrate-binding protein [Lachnospiraceae bacterium]MCH4104723.1 peptide ABC transporter substrate-binding protein [Lachnospiraceae bacterium]MCI1308634.1 peptide ABC transporter substrate-binding protein [Lachnospiraceae bacterium]